MAVAPGGSEISVNRHWIGGKVGVGMREVNIGEWKLLNTMYEILEALINRLFFLFK